MAKKIKHENGKVYKEVKPFYKRWWFILLMFIIIIGAIGSQGDSKENESKKADVKTENLKKEKIVESVNSPEIVEETKESIVEKNDVPKEYKSALKSAESYSKMMSMSKIGIYDQLTSEYGDKFTPEAAQYAVDNMEADWNANALKSAENYQEMMSMSPEAIKDQLVSEHGEKFTEEEAQYAVDNLSK